MLGLCVPLSGARGSGRGRELLAVCCSTQRGVCVIYLHKPKLITKRLLNIVRLRRLLLMLQVAVASCCCSCSCVGFTVSVASLGKQQFYIAEMREYIEEHQLSRAQLAELLTHRHHLFAYHINFLVDLLKE